MCFKMSARNISPNREFAQRISIDMDDLVNSFKKMALDQKEYLHSNDNSHLKALQYRLLYLNSNKEIFPRAEYLVYAQSRTQNARIYCTSCLLFGKGKSCFRTDGLEISNDSTYSNINKLISSHERTRAHFDAYSSYEKCKLGMYYIFMCSDPSFTIVTKYIYSV